MSSRLKSRPGVVLPELTGGAVAAVMAAAIGREGRAAGADRCAGCACCGSSSKIAFLIRALKLMRAPHLYNACHSAAEAAGSPASLMVLLRRPLACGSKCIRFNKFHRIIAG